LRVIARLDEFQFLAGSERFVLSLAETLETTGL